MKRSITEIGMVRLPASSARLFQLWLTLLGRLASWLDVVGSTNVDGARKASHATETTALTALHSGYLLLGPLASYVGRGTRPLYSRLTAHEWGTFTSIADSTGRAAQWSPLTGSTDLPAFVEHSRNAGFKLGLRGTVRMETPVLYLYDSREETVSVKVAFSKGVITEWYPRASRVEPAANIFDGTLYQPHADGSIAWDSLIVSPV